MRIWIYATSFFFFISNQNKHEAHRVGSFPLAKDARMSTQNTLSFNRLKACARMKFKTSWGIIEKPWQQKHLYLDDKSGWIWRTWENNMDIWKLICSSLPSVICRELPRRPHGRFVRGASWAETFRRSSSFKWNNGRWISATGGQLTRLF